MALGALTDESDLKAWLDRELDGSALAILIRQLQAAPAVPTFTVATRPAGATRPALIYVSDAAGGTRFQGWDATAGAWAPLG